MSLAILNKLFGGVYVLYLPSNPTKRARLAAQLQNVDVQWVEGVDAAAHTLDDLRARVIALAGPQCAPINPNIRPKNLAIWLGQYEIRERIRQSGQRALVLEDDAWFVPDAARRLAHYAEELSAAPINDTWDLLYLYRENPAGPIDAACHRLWGGSIGFPGGHRCVPPVLPGQANRGGPALWQWIETGRGCRPEYCAAPRELIQRDDGSILDHVYRAASERISTVAYACSPAAVTAMYCESTIWTNDWWLARLTEPGHPLRRNCYGLTPAIVWPRGQEVL